MGKGQERGHSTVHRKHHGAWGACRTSTAAALTCPSQPWEPEDQTGPSPWHEAWPWSEGK